MYFRIFNAIVCFDSAAKKPRNVTFNTTPFSVFLRWELPILQTGPTYYRAYALDSRNNINTSSCLTTGFCHTSKQ